jgi:hypothetical protein
MSRKGYDWESYYSNIEDEAFLKDDWKRAVDAGRFDVVDAVTERLRVLKQEGEMTDFAEYKERYEIALEDMERLEEEAASLIYHFGIDSIEKACREVVRESHRTTESIESVNDVVDALHVVQLQARGFLEAFLNGVAYEETTELVAVTETEIVFIESHDESWKSIRQAFPNIPDDAFTAAKRVHEIQLEKYGEDVATAIPWICQGDYRDLAYQTLVEEAPTYSYRTQYAISKLEAEIAGSDDE